jgi:hypothetical protein
MPPQTQIPPPMPGLCAKHSGIESKLDEHERRLNEQDALIQKIFNKIDTLVEQTKKPGWFTTTIVSMLTFLLGGSLTVIAVLMRHIK